MWALRQSVAERLRSRAVLPQNGVMTNFVLFELSDRELADNRRGFPGTTGSASQVIRERPRFRDTISRTVPSLDRQLRPS
jgi:hypothetical protein